MKFRRNSLSIKWNNEIYSETKNTTAAIWIEGVPPILNGLRIERSARDGVHFYEPSAPIIIANSTIVNNR